MRAILSEHPEMPATVIAGRVDWTGSITWFRDNVRLLRPQYRHPDPADRLVWEPGGAAQCDLWFPPKRIPLEDGSSSLLPVVVIVAAHSRFTVGRMLPTRGTEDLLLGSWELIRALGRVPRRLIWDNEPGIGRGGRLVTGVSAFVESLASRLVQLPPHDPQSKGVVQRRNGFFETSFMPGRSFSSPADFGRPVHRLAAPGEPAAGPHDEARPVDLLDADLAKMLPLPPVTLLLGWRERVRLGRDCYVRLDASDYSVAPVAIGRMVDVTADLDRVQVRLDGRLLADTLGGGPAGARSPTRRTSRPRRCCAGRRAGHRNRPPTSGSGIWPTTTAGSA